MKPAKLLTALVIVSSVGTFWQIRSFLNMNHVHARLPLALIRIEKDISPAHSQSLADFRSRLQTEDQRIRGDGAAGVVFMALCLTLSIAARSRAKKIPPNQELKATGRPAP